MWQPAAGGGGGNDSLQDMDDLLAAAAAVTGGSQHAQGGNNALAVLQSQLAALGLGPCQQQQQLHVQDRHHRAAQQHQYQHRSFGPNSAFRSGASLQQQQQQQQQQHAASGPQHQHEQAQQLMQNLGNIFGGAGLGSAGNPAQLQAQMLQQQLLATGLVRDSISPYPGIAEAF